MSKYKFSLLDSIYFITVLVRRIWCFVSDFLVWSVSFFSSLVRAILYGNLEENLDNKAVLTVTLWTLGDPSFSWCMLKSPLRLFFVIKITVICRLIFILFWRLIDHLLRSSFNYRQEKIPSFFRWRLTVELSSIERPKEIIQFTPFLKEKRSSGVKICFVLILCYAKTLSTDVFRR